MDRGPARLVQGVMYVHTAMNGGLRQGGNCREADYVGKQA